MEWNGRGVREEGQGVIRECGGGGFGGGSDGGSRCRHVGGFGVFFF